MADYLAWKKKSEALEMEVWRLRQHIHPDQHAATVAYLIEQAETSINAAKCLCDMRLTQPVPEPPLDAGM